MSDEQETGVSSSEWVDSRREKPQTSQNTKSVLAAAHKAISNGKGSREAGAKFKLFYICHLLFAICHLKFSYR